jgi:hypothetical protein
MNLASDYRHTATRNRSDRFNMTTSLRLTSLLLLALVAVHAARAATPERKSSDASEITKPAAATEKDNKESVAETVTFLLKGKQQTVRGRTVVEAADGGVLFEGVDGVIWSIEHNELQGRERLGTPFKPLTSAELSEQILAELPAGFRTHTTPHYVVCYNTSRAYAQWTGSLLERLYQAFTNYWQHRGFDLHEPEFPLGVVVFADRTSYDQASREDLPAGTGNIVGFYSLRSNRINMFDLTGSEVVSKQTGVAANRRGSMREINQMLSQPAATPLVATVVHEATHQIAFNCGMQTRFADIPLWLCEGMAVYFEAPDLASRSGWQGIGRLNYPRLERFRTNLTSWHDGSLEEMLTGSKRFRDPHTALDAYADAWALNYYLIKYQPKPYTAYLKNLAEKRPLIEDNPKQRLAEFRKHFGDPRKLEQDFLKQMLRVK